MLLVSFNNTLMNCDSSSEYLILILTILSKGLNFIKMGGLLSNRNLNVNKYTVIFTVLYIVLNILINLLLEDIDSKFYIFIVFDNSNELSLDV